MRRGHAPPENLCLLYNVQGLSPAKLANLILWMREKRARAMILTETWTDSDPVDLLQRLSGGGVIWPGARLYGAPGTGRTGGVIIVLSPGTQLDDVTVFSPNPIVAEGRILRLDLTLHGTPMTFIGVYGPAQQEHRSRFYTEVLPPIMPAQGRPIVIGGDLNCVTSIKDCFYPVGQAAPAVNSRFVGGIDLNSLMDTHGLIDIWRTAHPDTIEVTHMSRAHNTGARLDRWLVNEAFRQAFPCSSAIMPAGPTGSDHLPVSLSFKQGVPSVPRSGPD